jgi:hypothetical protein
MGICIRKELSYMHMGCEAYILTSQSFLIQMPSIFKAPKFFLGASDKARARGNIES